MFEVQNQPPPLEPYNLFATDAVLRDVALQRAGETPLAIPRAELRLDLRALYDERRIVIEKLRIEKPHVARGHNVATGLWVLRHDVFDRARQLRPSARGEYEMTDVLAAYARQAVLVDPAVQLDLAAHARV